MPTIGRRNRLASLPTLLSIFRVLSLPRSVTARPAWKRSSSAGPAAAEWIVSAALAGSEDASKPPVIEPEDPPDSPVFWWKLGLSVGLVLLGGVFAGLTLALMGSDDLNLRVLSTSSDDPKERKAAAKVLRLLQRGRHWVLVVLLLSNVIVNESLPIFLDDVLGGGLYAVIVSTTMIVIFGEIIPQAVCVRYGLRIGGACAPLVLSMMYIFFPIAYPIAKLLDWILGRDEGHTYKKAELKSFLQFHKEGEEPLRDDEIGILNGVLSLNEKRVQTIMTPIKDCLTLSSDKILDHETIDQILLSGFSRIPIHEPNQPDNFMGMLLVKRLITYNPEDAWPISKLSLLPLPEARPDINCFQALDYFQTGRAHLLLISETPGSRGGALGIVSLEDLIEEIIGEEIIDETDRYQDNHSRKIAKRAGTGAVMRGIIERHRNAGHLSRRPSGQAVVQATDSQIPVQLGVPSGTNDGLLIQFNEGALVAEPVAIPDDSNGAVRVSGKRLVVGNNAPSGGTGDLPRMESIDERTALLSADNADTSQDEQKKEGNDRDLLGITEDSDNGTPSQDIQAGHEQDDGGLIEDTMVFPSHEEFERAALAFLDRYNGSGETSKPGPSRTNRGWEWREHKNKHVQHHGYLYRRATRHVHASAADGGGETEREDGRFDEQDGESDDEESAHDPSEHQRLLPPPPSTVSGTEHGPDGSSGSKSGTVDRGNGNGNGQLERIEVEHHIIYSRTYHVPQLLIRAWGSSGAPLPLSSLVSYSLIRPNAQVPSHTDDSRPERDDVILLDPHSPFPLIQQIEHPTTGEVVWSVHPCQVAQAVEEVVQAERATTPVPQRGGRDSSEGGPPRTADGVDWLETWMMISSGVVDLVYA